MDDQIDDFGIILLAKPAMNISFASNFSNLFFLLLSLNNELSHVCARYILIIFGKDS
jgi:hypothetical protein